MKQKQILINLVGNCSKNLSLDKGLEAHGLVLRMGFESDLLLNNGLISMYGKCGRTELASFVFDKMPERDVVSWTSLMRGYLQNGNANKCLSIFRRMGHSDAKPSEFTLSTGIKASGIVGVAENGMQIHGLCAKSGFEWSVVVGNSIIDMYAKCGRFREATKMFGAMPVRCLITWNVMIAKYADKGNGKRALHLFRDMQVREIPDEFSFTSTLKACSAIEAFRQGRQLHASVITRGVSGQFQTAVEGALIDMYVKCRRLVEARRVFERTKQKNVISWSALILGYAQEGNLDEAVSLFRKLRQSNHNQIDGYALSSLISVFADFALVEQGKQIHAVAIKIASSLETSVANSILDMYFKCGMLHESEKLFSRMVSKDVVSWSAMITGYGKHGLGRQAIDLFNKMQSDNNIEPDYVSYLAVLTACSHSGLVDEGQEIFTRLLNDRRVKPKVDHYACMVNLLGRTGQLREAKSLIDNMAVRPHAGIWRTLLSACRVHRDVELAREVGEKLIELDGINTVNYVILSNIYADAGQWKECERLRQVMKMKGLKKEAGRSWVEIDKEVHFFYSRDDSHPLIGEIHKMLEGMERRMKAEIGYVPGLNHALHDVEDESKEESLRVHSEKLAIGLALVLGNGDGKVEEMRTIRIFKNLRVCVDCHSFIKGLSKVLKIVFLVRDANRFHKFQDGLCSCGDYW